jgi:outer membrane lipoprotein-sorting protein
MLVLVLVGPGGCAGSGEGTTPGEQAKTDADRFQRPRRLLPDVEALPPTSTLGGVGAPAVAGAPAAPTGVPAAGAEPAAASLPAELQTAAQELAAKSPTLRTVAFEIRGSRTSGGAEAGAEPQLPLNGRVEAVPPDRIRIEGTGQMQGQDVKMLMVMNGPKMWLEMRDASTNEPKQVIKMDLAAMPGAEVTREGPLATPTASGVLGNLGRRVAFDSVRDEDLDGEPCKVFEGKARQTEPGKEPTTTRVWFSTNDGMVRRIQEVDAGGQTTMEMRILKIEANPPIPVSRFDYAPPAGVTVVDMAEMIKQMTEGVGKTGEEMRKAVEQGAPAAPEPTPAAPEPTPAAPEPTPAAPEPTPAAPEPTPAAPEATPAAPGPTPAAPEATPAAPEPTPAAPEPTPAAPTGPVDEKQPFKETF